MTHTIRPDLAERLLVPGVKVGDTVRAILPRHEPDASGRRWWCNSHQRPATHLLLRAGMKDSHVCAPGQSGILLPCFAVDITDEAEIEA